MKELKETNMEIEKQAQYIAQYIKKYVPENTPENDSMVEQLKLDLEFQEMQWALIIERAWNLAYSYAIADDEINPQEKLQLQYIYQLSQSYQSQPKIRYTLNNKIVSHFRNIYALEKNYANEHNPAELKNESKKRWQAPKPTPWDDWNK